MMGMIGNEGNGVVPRDTRAAAFADAKERAGVVRDRVITALSDMALTSDEVATRIGESVLTVRPTVTTLIKDGTLVKTALRRRNVSGKYATVVMLAA